MESNSLFNLRRADRGTALILVAVLMVFLTGVSVAMMNLHVARSRSLDSSLESQLGLNSAESGLLRFQALAKDKGMAWVQQLATGQIEESSEKGLRIHAITDDLEGRRVKCGLLKFTHHGHHMEVVVKQDRDAAWYHLESYCSRRVSETHHLKDVTDPAHMARIYAVGATCHHAQTREEFTEFMRFQSGDHRAGCSNLRYYGKLHSNGREIVTGRNVQFYEDVTSHGRMTSRPDTVFHKKHDQHVDPVKADSFDKIVDWVRSQDLVHPAWNVTATPPAAERRDPKSWWYRAVHRSRLNGHGPSMAKHRTSPDGSKIRMYVKLRRYRMDVKFEVRARNGRTYWLSEHNVPVPDNKVIYLDGRLAGIKGEMSRRMSFLIPGASSRRAESHKAYITGSIRYVNDRGDPQYKLFGDVNRDGLTPNYDSVAPTRRVKHTDRYINRTGRMPWSTWEWRPSTWSGRWVYAEDPSWRAPRPDGSTPQHPQLGIISDYSYRYSANYVHVMYGSGGSNLEMHFSGFHPGKTLHCDTYTRNIGYVGSYIHDHYMTCRGGTATYLYDQHARTNAPPGFPQFSVEKPELCNWHVISY